MAESKEQLSQLANDFQKLLECPVCFGTMDSTLKQCVNGHGICNDCATKVEKCPSCQQELVAVFRQNTLLKQLLDRLPLPCRYAKKGCTDVVLDKDHQTYCQYRPTNCMIDRCLWKKCVKDLLEHLKSYHGFVVPNICFNKETKIKKFASLLNTTISYPLRADNEIFCNKTFIKISDAGKKSIFQSVIHLPTSKPDFKYYMTMSISNGDMEFKHTCEAIALDNIESFPGEKLWESGVVMSDDMFDEIVIKNKYWFTMKIVKKSLH